MMQLPAIHVMFVSSVKHRQVTSYFGQASERSLSSGKIICIFRKHLAIFCFMNCFSEVLPNLLYSVKVNFLMLGFKI